MILYRTQTHRGADWGNEWFGTLAEANDALNEAAEAGFEGHVDQLDILTDKVNLIYALDNAHCHRMNFPGVEKTSWTKEPS